MCTIAERQVCSRERKCLQQTVVWTVSGTPGLGVRMVSCLPFMSFSVVLCHPSHHTTHTLVHMHTHTHARTHTHTVYVAQIAFSSDECTTAVSTQGVCDTSNQYFNNLCSLLTSRRVFSYWGACKVSLMLGLLHTAQTHYPIVDPWDWCCSNLLYCTFGSKPLKLTHTSV